MEANAVSQAGRRSVQREKGARPCRGRLRQPRCSLQPRAGQKPLTGKTAFLVLPLLSLRVFVRGSACLLGSTRARDGTCGPVGTGLERNGPLPGVEPTGGVGVQFAQHASTPVHLFPFDRSAFAREKRSKLPSRCWGCWWVVAGAVGKVVVAAKEEGGIRADQAHNFGWTVLRSSPSSIAYTHKQRPHRQSLPYTHCLYSCSALSARAASQAPARLSLHSTLPASTDSSTLI